MKKLTDTAIRAALAKPRTRRTDLADGAVSGLALRIGRTRGATWSLQFRVVGEGGVTNRGHVLKGAKHRISLGSYPEVSLESARAKARRPAYRELKNVLGWYSGEESNHRRADCQSGAENYIIKCINRLAEAPVAFYVPHCRILQY